MRGKSGLQQDSCWLCVDTAKFGTLRADTLNGSAHASFATIVTCIEFAKKPEFRAPIG